MITIRKGEKRDLEKMLELIVELAVYENAPQEVTNTIQMMEKDGFGDNINFGGFEFLAIGDMAIPT